MTGPRVLIVDDSSTVRMILRDYLGREPSLEIAGAARNGREALDRLDAYQPDVVLLDIDMPELNGLETLPRLRELRPDLPVIMFSRLTGRGASETVEALFLGASDYILKPESGDALKECVANELVPKLLALAESGMAQAPGGTEKGFAETGGSLRSTPATQRPKSVAKPTDRTVRQRADTSHSPSILAIAASTGGPRALAELIPMLPADLPVPVVIVQHMPPGFTGAVAERLDSLSPFTIREAKDDQPLSDADIWIAPGNRHMVIRGSASGVRVQCHDGPPENSCRPAADVLFRSVLSEFGASTLAVVLTGMGNDGLASCREIVECGGRVLVQDEASSAVWGMPGQVARAGLADAILPLSSLGPELSLRLMRRRPS